MASRTVPPAFHVEKERRYEELERQFKAMAERVQQLEAAEQARAAAQQSAPTSASTSAPAPADDWLRKQFNRQARNLQLARDNAQEEDDDDDDDDADE